MPGFSPKITFGREESLDEAHLSDRRQLWRTDGVASWDPGSRDVLFLGGVEDWLYLDECGLGSLPNPRISLVQGFLDEYEASIRERYLAQKAIWICVSQELADEISATVRTKIPIQTIPNGTERPPADVANFRQRSVRVPIIGFKRPALAYELSKRLSKENIQHHGPGVENVPRGQFLARLVESRVAVCLPSPKEGFYLVALEAMAAGCLVVTLDCIGNRGFCKDGENCLIAEPCIDSLCSKVQTARVMPDPEREKLLQGRGIPWSSTRSKRKGNSFKRSCRKSISFGAWMNRSLRF